MGSRFDPKISKLLQNEGVSLVEGGQVGRGEAGRKGRVGEPAGRGEV